ncbi:Vitamin K epoxide reductase [Microbacterium sp. cx-55]|uniref:vitamin K epoxide reductase family protein n=1 Tax=unclassified Microbacterium TaxID=2609290 RepID=UPI001CBD7309|nr:MULTISPECIES: vitamin K epoxide reductase family protein [unclassified Microbacterium]MBZ4486794.1 Vitamin K epoxide reductase [Microbacterium sp. cx-55]MCC4907815.1 Vitamin K epoxide reductase [Microbacterium sp. cx-59]UGB36250.1 Vitamin K epoxide reductase [Microbacterium sp. cx-55]
MPVRTASPARATAIFWIVAGLIGEAVSFLLYLEYVGQLTGADAIVSCQLSVIVTCGPNLLSPGGNLLGFSNSIIGIVMFLGPVYAGVSALAASGGHRLWFWRVYQCFLAAGFALVHLFAYRSIFEYGSLCPWCMIVWLVTVPLFWVTLGWTLRAGVWGVGSRGFGQWLRSWAPLIAIVNLALIAVVAQVRLDALGSLF